MVYTGTGGVAVENYEFSWSFEMGSLQISPVHMRIEQLRPIIAAHRHSNVSYEIHYTARGRGTVAVNGTEYDVLPGRLFVTGPGVLHSQYSELTDPVVEYCLYMNCRQFMRAAGDPLALFANTHFWMGMDDGRVFSLLRQLVDENRVPRPETAQMSEALLRQTVVLLTRLYRSDAALPSAAPVAPALTRDGLMPIIEDAFFYRYATLTLQELARLLNLSVRQTQRLLRVSFGKTFSQKLTEARMAAASQFLKDTALSVTEIAERVGFSSIEHFSSAFRRFMGCSPRQYRQGEGARFGEKRT